MADPFDHVTSGVKRPKDETQPNVKTGKPTIKRRGVPVRRHGGLSGKDVTGRRQELEKVGLIVL